MASGSGAVRKITTQLALDGEQAFSKQMAAATRSSKQFGAEIKEVEAQLRNEGESVELLGKKHDLLGKQMEQQEENIRALEEVVRQAGEKYGKTAETTDKYRLSLTRAKTELNKMKAEQRDVAKAMDKLGSESREAAADINEVGDAADKSGSSMGGLENSLGKLKGLLAGAVTVGAVKELAEGLLEIEESTREYRRSASMLEATSKSLGYSTNQTAQAYEYLMGVMGDGQAANTAVANLQALQAPQSKLMELIQGTAGAQVKWQSSINVESLTESISETIRAGQVTGQFADVLNWGTKEGERFGVTLRANTKANEEWNKAVSEAKTAEDFFNLALQETESQAERTQLVIDAMAGQGLPGLEQAWRANNEAIVAANLEQDKWEKAMARVGEFVAPAAAALKSFGADAVNWLIDRMSVLTGWINEAWGSLTQSEEYLAKAERINYSLTPAGKAETAAMAQKTQGIRTELNENALWNMSNPPAESSIPAYMQEATAAMWAIASQHEGKTRGNQTTLNVNLNVDGRKLGEVTVPYLEAEMNRQGENMIGPATQMLRG